MDNKKYAETRDLSSFRVWVARAIKICHPVKFAFQLKKTHTTQIVFSVSISHVIFGTHLHSKNIIYSKFKYN